MYATRQDMIDRYGEEELIQLTDRDGFGAIDDTVLNKALADADAEIDGYLGALDLPLADVPPALNLKACEIARYYLYNDQPTETVAVRYEMAIKWLTRVAKGDLVLVKSTGAIEPDNGTVLVQGSDLVFTDSKLENY